MAKREDVAVIERPEGDQGERAPVVVLIFGRGRTGKSVMARALAEDARQRGRPVILADAERTRSAQAGKSLADFYGADVVLPKSTGDLDMRDWFDGLIEHAIEQRKSLVIDAGAGETLLRRQAAEIDLVELLGGYGVALTGIHMIGPDPADLDNITIYEAPIAEGGRALLAPPQTIIVPNAGVVPAGRSAGAAWEKLAESPVMQAVIRRGARLVVMPPLSCMAAIEEAALPFLADARGVLKLMDQQRRASWWREWKGALVPVAEWVP